MLPERIEDILAFVRAADARSFTVAAEQLGLSRSTIGKRLARLETRLGVRLLHRTTRNVTLTDEGTAFYDSCTDILQALEVAEAAMVARSVSPSGRLRIDVPASLGRLQVMTVIQDYMRRWPMVSVTVSFNDRYVDLVDEGIDVAIRVGGMIDSRLISRTVAPHRLITCASPDYLARHGIPRSIDDLAAHDCLTFQHNGRVTDWRFAQDGEPDMVPVSGGLCATNAEVLRDAAVAGFGIAQLATFLISDELNNGKLIPVLADYATDGEPLFVVYPIRRLLPPKVKAFVDLLITSWQPSAPWDQGNVLTQG